MGELRIYCRLGARSPYLRCHRIHGKIQKPILYHINMINNLINLFLTIFFLETNWYILFLDE